MKPRLHYDSYRRAYYLQWDADSDHIGRQEPVFERTREYIESLEAENAKLQASNEVIAEDHAVLCEQNAKLRELVRDMWEGYNDPRCEECHLKDTPTCADCPICARDASVINRIRELGIEADG